MDNTSLLQRSKERFSNKTERTLPSSVSSVVELAKATTKKKSYPLPTSSGRSSQIEDNDDTGNLSSINAQYKTVKHPFLVQTIPIIRSLVYMNEDMSQALHNIVSLGNTGHKVFFDKKVSPDQQDEMRNHLENKKKEWASGQAGMDGLVNKWFAQLMISGALSNEWVPNVQLNGIESNVIINPENIYAVRSENKVGYEWYQKRTAGYWNFTNYDDMVKLNPDTYKYFALNGDTDLPYGIPPYLAALNRVKSQRSMLSNIEFIIDQISLLGFLEVLLAKPPDDMGEFKKDGDYDAYLQSYLNEAKIRMSQSIKDGVIIGFDGDHEFKFNSFGKEYESALSLFKNNEQLLSSALKQDLTLMGRDYNTSETQITVIFMKLLSELRNIQNTVGHNMEFGYALELRLAGFQFDNLKVRFNRSTIQDDMKYQQAEEVKIRNVAHKYIMGMIDSDGMADELGYEAPAGAPLVDPEVLIGVAAPAPEGGVDAPAKKKEAAKKKDASDKKVRSKNKPVPKDK